MLTSFPHNKVPSIVNMKLTAIFAIIGYITYVSATPLRLQQTSLSQLRESELSNGQMNFQLIQSIISSLTAPVQ
jgi:hypothetical protein